VNSNEFDSFKKWEQAFAFIEQPVLPEDDVEKLLETASTFDPVYCAMALQRHIAAKYPGSDEAQRYHVKKYMHALNYQPVHRHLNQPVQVNIEQQFRIVSEPEATGMAQLSDLVQRHGSLRVGGKLAQFWHCDVSDPRMPNKKRSTLALRAYSSAYIDPEQRSENGSGIMPVLADFITIPVDSFTDYRLHAVELDGQPE
jgi:hypothetical protein